MIATTITVKDPVRRNQHTRAILIDEIIYEPLTRYFRSRNFSIASEIGYARAVCQLMNWTHAARPGVIINASNAADSFNSFLHDLLRGTKHDTQLDAALGWQPCSPEALSRAAQRIAEFSEWLADTEPHVAVNPTNRLASAAERLITMHAFSKKKTMSMLAHLYSRSGATESSNRVRQIAAPGRANSQISSPAAFPVDRIGDLLWTGFENEKFKDDPRSWMRWNLRDILITLICLYGGARQSEPLHLWVDDVYEDRTDPLSCKVLIHAPEIGLVDYFDRLSGKMTSSTRAEYLAARNKQPLTLEIGRRHAGWKGGLLTDRKRRAFEIFWIAPDASRLFREVWDLYIRHVRPTMPNTPWAFLTKDGMPMGTASYADSFKDAVAKIGLRPNKESAGTPHALRHRYGQWLNDLGISDKAGQVCMHHASIHSQATYRQISVENIAREMQAKALSKPGLVILPSWGSHV